MKKIKHQIIASILAFSCMVSLFPTNISASEINNSSFSSAELTEALTTDACQSILYSLKNDSSRIGVNQNEAIQATFGTPFYIHSIDDAGEVSPILNEINYPIYFQNKWIATMAVSKGETKGRYLYRLEKNIFEDYTDINNLINDTVLALNPDTNEYFSISSNGAPVNLTSGIQVLSDNINEVQNVDDLFQYDAELERLPAIDLNMLNNISTYSVTHINNDCYITGYGHVTQQGSGSSCWAATVLSIIKYKNSAKFGNYTLQNIYNDTNRELGYSLAFGQEAPYISDGPDMLKYYLPNNSFVSYLRHLTSSEIINNISKSNPIYMRLGSTYHGGHVVSLVGYRTSTTNQNTVVNLWLMDPNKTNVTLVTENSYSDSSSYSMTINGYIYKWSYSFCFA